MLVKRWVPNYERDFLWAHMREIREGRGDRQIIILNSKTTKGDPQGRPEQEFIMKVHAVIPARLGYDSEGISRGGSSSGSTSLSAKRSTEDEKLSPEEAEKLMDEFLATFSSDGTDISGGWPETQRGKIASVESDEADEDDLRDVWILARLKRPELGVDT